MSKFGLLSRELIPKIITLGKVFYTEYKAKKDRSSFWQDKLIKWPAIICFSLNLLIWIFIIWRFFSKEEVIPLHYNVYFGVDLVGKRLEIFKLPIIGFFILIINFILSLIIHKDEKLASYILLFVALFCQLILLLGSFLILNI